MNILKFLDEKNITQQELGDSLGTSNQNVNRWVTGKGVPSYEFCKKLLELGITVEDLFGVSYNDLHNLIEGFTEEEKLQKDEFESRIRNVVDEYMKESGVKDLMEKLDRLNAPMHEAQRKFDEAFAPTKKVLDDLDKNKAKTTF